MIYLSIAILVLLAIVIYLWVRVDRLEDRIAVIESNNYLIERTNG